MTSDQPAVTVSVPCPTCGIAVETETDREESGLLVAKPVSLRTLRKHMNCDFWKISIALSNEAYRQSSVAAITIKGEN